MTNSCNISAAKYTSRLRRPMVSRSRMPGTGREGYMSMREARSQERRVTPIVCSRKGGVQSGFEMGRKICNTDGRGWINRSESRKMDT
jgi:hypothetical protein